MKLSTRGWLDALFGLALVVCGPAVATPISVANFSFELPALGPGGIAPQSPPGWIKSGIGGVQHPDCIAGDNPFPCTAAGLLPGTADGHQFAFVSGDTSTGGAGSFTSALPVVTTRMNTRYTLTAALGNPVAGIPGLVTIELLVDGVSVAAFSTMGNEIPEGTFTDFSTSFFSIGSGQNLTIQLTNIGPQGYFDNVRLDSTFSVPEPSTLVLAGIGLLLLGRARKFAAIRAARS